MAKKKEFMDLEISRELVECIKNSAIISCCDDLCIAENTDVFEYFLNAISGKTLDLHHLDLKIVPYAILDKLQPPTASGPSETVIQLTGILLALRNGGKLHIGMPNLSIRVQAFAASIVMERFRRKGILESYCIADALDPNTNVKVSFNELFLVNIKAGLFPTGFRQWRSLN